jgi:hypothetical protein
MTSPPRVELDFKVHWCPRHLEPFREDWPGGAGAAMVKLFEAAVRDERIVAACPKDSAGLAMTEALDAVLREHSPLCCFIGDDAMAAIYAEVDREPPPS